MDEGPLTAWLGLVLGAPGLPLESFVEERLFLRALRVIAPHFAPPDDAAVREEATAAAFDAAIQALDRAELHFPPGSPLLRINWPLLLGPLEGGQLSVAQRQEAVKVAKLLLGAAVKCNDKATFVSQIQRGLPPAAQKALMVVIQQELLKEPVPTREEKLSDERQLRERVAELEARAADRDALARQNAELIASCAALEKELQASRAERPNSKAATVAAASDGGEEQRALKERLWLVQDELARREEENLQLAAAAAEAAARVRENRQLRDEVDVARETIAELRQSLQDAAASAAAVNASAASAKELTALREQARAAQAEARAHQEAAAKLRADVAQLRGECAELTGERGELRTGEALLRSQLERATASFLEAKAQQGELSLQLENARREALVLKQAAPLNAAVASEPIGGSLADEMGEPLKAELALKNEQLRLLEEERDQLLEDLARAKARVKTVVVDDKAAAELKAAAAKHAEQARLLEEERDQLLEDLKRAKAIGKTPAVDDKAELRAAAAKHAEEKRVAEERIKALEAEREQLRQYLKMAKEKLVAAPAASAPCGHELELKTMAAKVHAAGAEILRLRNELRQDRAPDPNKHNGLLNHLRHAIDSYSM